jgi:hypothetical protein
MMSDESTDHYKVLEARLTECEAHVERLQATNAALAADKHNAEAQAAQLRSALRDCFQQLQDQQAMPDNHNDDVYLAALGNNCGAGWVSPKHFHDVVDSLTRSQEALQRWMTAFVQAQDRITILDVVAHKARYAAAELRHIYKHSFLVNKEVDKHDEGLISRAIKAIETALAKLDKFDSFKVDNDQK